MRGVAELMAEEATRAAVNAVIASLAEEIMLQDLTTEQLKAMYAKEEERQIKMHERGCDAQEYLRTVLCKRAILKIINERRRTDGVSKEHCSCDGKEQSVPGAGEAVGSDL